MNKSLFPVTLAYFTEPPTISEAIQKSFAEPITFQAGDDVVVSIPVSGIPKPTVTLLSNGQQIADDGLVLFLLIF